MVGGEPGRDRVVVENEVNDVVRGLTREACGGVKCCQSRVVK